MDSVRAKNLSLFGYPQSTTPFLEDFANDATVYTQARAPGPSTLVSHVSMFTGIPVYEHGVISSEYELALGETIWEQLKESGYNTASFTDNPFWGRRSVGLDRGFENTYQGKSQSAPLRGGLNPREYTRKNKYLIDTIQNSPVKSTINGALHFADSIGIAEEYLTPSFAKSADIYIDLCIDWIDRQDSDWAGFINLLDAHKPYKPNKKHNKWGGNTELRLQNKIDDQTWDFIGKRRPIYQRRSLESLYNGGIRQIDYQLNRLVSSLKNRGQYDNTLLIIVSDHGSGFGERSWILPNQNIVGHTVGAHEVLLHVPLIIKYPNQTKGNKIDELFTLTDIPELIRSTVEPTENTDFCTDSPVISAAPGVERATAQYRKAERYCGSDVQNLTGWIKVVYERKDGEIIKHMKWKSNEVSIYPNAKKSNYGECEISSHDFDSLHNLDNRDVSEIKESKVDNKVLAKLQDLGLR